MMDNITLSEFAVLCRKADPAKQPSEATALLQEAAKVAETLDKMKNRLKSDKDNKLQQAAEMISQAADLLQPMQELSVLILENTAVLQSISKAKTKKPKVDKPKSNKYGEYQHVLLTEQQYTKLVQDFGEKVIKEYITNVDEYCQQSGKKYKDYYLTVRNFLKRDNVIPKTAAPTEDKKDHSYDLNLYLEHAMNNIPKIEE